VVDVIGYLQDGVVLMSGKLTLSTPNQVNFNIIKTDGKQERRSYLKVKIQLRTKLLKAFSLGRSEKSYAVNETIQTRDLSLGGVGFYSNSIFFRKQKISIDFNCLKPGFIAKAEILRKERGPFKNGYRFKYGCRFLNIGSEEERVLCEFVFRTQLENHRRLLQMQEGQE
jgi:c-di-GMP-binding flagellar brake protein YcgR